jgi:putative transposase
MRAMSENPAPNEGADATAPSLVSHTGVPLSRTTTFRFTLDPNRAQHQQLLSHAGAARLAFNHHIGRVKANLGQRDAERSYGVPETALTPSLSWSKVSFINEMNAWKDGRSPDARVSLDADGTVVRGLAWRGEVSADVFECASVNAAQALANWKKSRTGQQAGKGSGRQVGFPRFKSRHKTAAAFRLRAKYTEGEKPPPVRPAGPRALRLPKLGQLRTHEHTGQLAKLLARGRFHVYAASVRYERGRWTVAVTGVAAEFHHQRRSPSGRHQARVGVDLGVNTLAVVADENGSVLHAHQGVKALQHAQARLKLAGHAYSRTKTGSTGRTRAAQRLGKVHARVANLRRDLLHRVTTDLARGYTSVTIEDLNTAGMLTNHRLARVVSDAAFGEFRRELTYKTAWYGTGLVVADRWFPSSKTCSGCGQVKSGLTLAERTYRCDHPDGCGLVIDRDVNAAINLARYTPPPPKEPMSPPLPAAA